jgi:hypothetical protein
MARTRDDQYELQIERETTAGDGANFAGAELTTKIKNLSINGDGAELMGPAVVRAISRASLLPSQMHTR